jgi:hypothetical protein
MDNAALDDEKESRKEEKLTSIMEAANALTALGDEDDVAVPLAPASVSTTSKDIVDDEYRNAHDNDDDGKDKETVDNPAERKTSANHVVASTEVGDEPHESSTTTTTTAAALAATATPTTSTAATTTTTTTVTKQEDYDGGGDNKVINNTTGSDEAIDTSTPAPNGITTTGTTAGSNSKRFLPEHKKPDAAPTFPEKVGQHGIDSCLICHSRVVIFSSDDSHLNLFRFFLFCFEPNTTNLPISRK